MALVEQKPLRTGTWLIRYGRCPLRCVGEGRPSVARHSPLTLSARCNSLSDEDSLLFSGRTHLPLAFARQASAVMLSVGKNEKKFSQQIPSVSTTAAYDRRFPELNIGCCQSGASVSLHLESRTPSPPPRKPVLSIVKCRAGERDRLPPAPGRSGLESALSYHMEFSADKSR